MEEEYLRRIAEALERIANHLETGPAGGSEVLALSGGDEERGMSAPYGRGELGGKAIRHELAIVVQDSPLSAVEHTPPPSWLNADNLDQLTAELAAFSKAQMPESEGNWSDHTVVAAFWEAKGLLNHYRLASKERLLIERVEMRVIQIRQQKAEEEAAARVAREQSLLPVLIEECLLWAKSRQIKRLNQADVAAILQEAHQGLDHTTLRNVWQQVNLGLKG